MSTGRRQDDAPGDALGGEVRRDAERQRALTGVLDQGQREGVLVPGEHEDEGAGRGDAGQHHGQQHIPDQREAVAPVDPGGVVQLPGNRPEIGAEVPDAEGEREGRMRDNERGKGVDEAEPRQQHEQRHEQQDARKHVEDQHHAREQPPSGKFEPRDGVGREDGKRHRESDRAEHDQHAVARPEQERRFLDRDLEEVCRERDRQQAGRTAEEVFRRSQGGGDEEVDREQDEAQHRDAARDDDQPPGRPRNHAVQELDHGSRSAQRASGMARITMQTNMKTPSVAASLNRKRRKPSS